MRLLYVIDSLTASGGAEQALAAMAPSLVAGGIQLFVQPLEDRKGLQNRIEESGSILLPAIPGGRLTRLRALCDAIGRVNPDLVHTTLFEADICGRTAARWTGVPVVSSLVNVAYGPEQRRAVSRSKLEAARALDTATARAVLRFHAITEHVSEVMRKRLLLQRKPIDVIPRGRDLHFLGERTRDRRVAVRERLGILEEAQFVVSAARHEHQKGLDVSIRAFDLVRRTHPNAVYLIAGRAGNDTPLLEHLVQELGLTESVRLLGAREDVPDLLAAADVFVAPSRWEGLGSSALEAMALGAPLVTSDVPALRETLGGERQAWFVPVDDIPGFARGMTAVLSDPGSAAERALAARDRPLEVLGKVDLDGV